MNKQIKQPNGNKSKCDTFPFCEFTLEILKDLKRGKFYVGEFLIFLNCLDFLGDKI